MEYKFTSTESMTHDTAPQGKVLMKYLEPFFGVFSVKYGIGYYDNPNDYESGGDGWLLWDGDVPVLVIEYSKLPEEEDCVFMNNISQVEFIDQFGERPNFGCVGGLTFPIQ